MIAAAFINAVTVNSASTNPFTITLPGTPTNGNTLFLNLSVSAPAGVTISSITQTGVTWALVARSNSNTRLVEQWIGTSVSGAGTGITVNVAGGTGNFRGNVVEWNGITATTADTTANNTGSSSNPASATITPTAGKNMLLLAVGVGGGNSNSPTNGFTRIPFGDSANPVHYLVIPNTNASYNVSWTGTGSQAWEVIISAFSGGNQIVSTARGISTLTGGGTVTF